MSKENIIFSSIAVVGTVVSSFLGGWDVALKVLVVFIVADYVTGVLAALKRRQLNSEVMFWGGIRKGALMLVIAIAVLLDELIGNQAPVFRMLALYFYIAREGLSVIENLGLLGVWVPDAIKQILEQLQRDGKVPKSLQDVDQTLGKPVTAVESEAIRQEGADKDAG